MSMSLWDMGQAHMDELASNAWQRAKRARPGVATPLPGAPLRARASAWVGYKMIAFGCRLARPALVAAARAGA